MNLVKIKNSKPLKFFVLGLIVGLIGIFLINHKPLPMWANFLSMDFEESHIEFNRNVQKRFPVGSDYRDMVKELKGAGFKLSWFLENTAVHEKHRFICTFKREVYWTRDKDFKITSIGGRFKDICL